ncbi:glycosyltransferase [Patescibacteria group bacterium]|nr:MAG: glycosyltransferase [Patescibacteria group bacterium]
MRLLVVTQIVDTHDPILGFFHRWLEEFSKHFESIEVICLKEGTHSLPKNIHVHSLGKENGGNSVVYAVRFIGLVWKLRTQYDHVFVHMNPIYIVLVGWWWQLTKKRIGLWYTHKSTDMKLRIALMFSNAIFTASKESFRLSSKKVHVTGHGIDTDFFKPDSRIERGSHLLSVGRLMKSKRHDLAIHAAKDADVALRIAGEGGERERLTALARELGVQVTFLGGLTQLGLRDEYLTAAKLIHRSETGSLDKVVLEAAACGCLVDTTDLALKNLPLSPEYVREHHSLQKLIPCIQKAYSL